MKNYSKTVALFVWVMLAIIIGSVGFLRFTTVPAHHVPPPQQWGFKGPLGTYDKAALQRGFQVYKEVCAACHELKRIRFRELAALGFSEPQIKALAATYSIKILNESGEEAERPGIPSDAFPPIHPNELATRAANNGALPPDQSLIIKARPHGEDYIYALLTGYGQTPPKDIVVGEGRYYNPVMAGGQISMAPPLKDGQVTYSDGTKATVSQMAKDVVEFLSWTAEPEMEDRKRTGLAVLLYMLVMTIIFYAAKRKIWKDVK
ncbi:MAG: cytochrome c1 [Alphaproteobacteria bacterium]|nr:cytochrome c1 [Alphaproteobacteria bacterium]